jgi:hypothetical protein
VTALHVVFACPCAKRREGSCLYSQGSPQRSTSNSDHETEFLPEPNRSGLNGVTYYAFNGANASTGKAFKQRACHLALPRSHGPNPGRWLHHRPAAAICFTMVCTYELTPAAAKTLITWRRDTSPISEN